MPFNDEGIKMTTSYAISLDKESGGFKKVIKLPHTIEPDEIEEYFERLCIRYPQDKLVLVAEDRKSLLWLLCRRNEDLQNELRRKTDLDDFIDELKDLIDRYEE